MFNNYQNFPNTMKPYSYPPQMNQYPQPVQLIGAWVQGIEGAKGYQMPPNAVAVLLDSETEGMMYIKNTDGIGMSTLRSYKYTEHIEEPKKNPDLTEYVRKDELRDLIAKIAGGEKNESSV